jgi:hypothetical protein
VNPANMLNQLAEPASVSAALFRLEDYEGIPEAPTFVDLLFGDLD